MENKLAAILVIGIICIGCLVCAVFIPQFQQTAKDICMMGIGAMAGLADGSTFNQIKEKIKKENINETAN